MQKLDPGVSIALPETRATEVTRSLWLSPAALLGPWPLRLAEEGIWATPEGPATFWLKARAALSFPAASPAVLHDGELLQPKGPPANGTQNPGPTQV